MKLSNLPWLPHPKDENLQGCWEEIWVRHPSFKEPVHPFLWELSIHRFYVLLEQRHGYFNNFSFILDDCQRYQYHMYSSTGDREIELVSCT